MHCARIICVRGQTGRLCYHTPAVRSGFGEAYWCRGSGTRDWKAVKKRRYKMVAC